MMTQPANTDLCPHQPIWINKTFSHLFIVPFDYAFILWSWRQGYRKESLLGGIKAKSLQDEARGRRKCLEPQYCAMPGCVWPLTLQFVLTFWWRPWSRWWNAFLGVNRWMKDAKASNMGTAYCVAGAFLAVISVNCFSLLAGSAMKAWLQKDGQNGWESASDRHYEFAQCGEEPHFYFWPISALLEKNKQHKNVGKTNEQWWRVAAHILEWKNWAIISYFAIFQVFPCRLLNNGEM